MHLESGGKGAAAVFVACHDVIGHVTSSRTIEVRAFEKLQAALLRLAGEKRLLPAA